LEGYDSFPKEMDGKRKHPNWDGTKAELRNTRYCWDFY